MFLAMDQDYSGERIGIGTAIVDPLKLRVAAPGSLETLAK
jgi:hypothetical protein